MIFVLTKDVSFKYVSLHHLPRKLSQTKRGLGEYILKLSQTRHRSAISRYIYSVAVLIGTILLISIVRISLLGILLAFGGSVASYYLYQNGRYLMKRASDAQRGARAEAEVAELLDTLKYKGWEIEHNLPIKKCGDADVVLHSPQDNWYVIDVKSHNGTKVYEGGRLRKRYGRNTYDFQEGDLLRKVKGQAKEVRNLKRVRWVTPILCFTRGDIDIPCNVVSGVYVVEGKDLVSNLLLLDK